MTSSQSGERELRERPSLLIIEDDSELSLGLESYFSHAGYQVKVVSRGDDALEAIQSTDPDVVLLDWRLPEKTGVEVLREAREEGIETPAIMTSVHSEREIRKSDDDPEAEDYIAKPFDLEDLRARVASLLE